MTLSLFALFLRVRLPSVTVRVIPNSTNSLLSQLQTDQSTIFRLESINEWIQFGNSVQLEWGLVSGEVTMMWVI